MPSQLLHSTPTKPTRLRDGVSSSPSKFSTKPPSESRNIPPSPIRLGPGTPNNDAKEIAERRRARQSMSPTKPIARFDSICQESKTILNNMAGMFSPKKGEQEIPEASPLKIEIEVPPAMIPVKEQRGKDRCEDQRKEGRPRRKRGLNPGRVRRSACSPADRIPEEDTERRG